jgi:RNA polymerase sigma factor (sigma-70 family)
LGREGSRVTTMAPLSQRPVTLSDDIRYAINANRSIAAGATALPKMLKLLVNNTAATAAHDQPRPTADLVRAVSKGDHSAEEELYVRAAPELEVMAAKAARGSAHDVEDLHQEGAERLITDARAGKISERFGGELGPYLGRAVLAHLRNVASTQQIGRPTDPGRLAQKLREALRKTADKDGQYNLVAAAEYAHENFAWRLNTFLAVHRMMFAGADDLHQESPDGYALAETLADPSAQDTLTRVEAIESARALRNSGALTAREREVIDCLYGFNGPALSEAEAGKVLGVSQQAISKTKTKALAALRALTVCA